MTPEQKMQKIVEAAGECWHEWKIKNSAINKVDFVTGESSYGGHGYECVCGFKRLNRVNWNIRDGEPELGPNCNNPSHSDLNELFRLARKDVFCISHIDFEYRANGLIVCRLNKGEFVSKEFLEPSEALLNALYEATK